MTNYNKMDLGNVEICPVCKSKVLCVDSRLKDGLRIRKRQCAKCKYKYPTAEVSIEELDKIYYEMKRVEEIKRMMRDLIDDLK